MTTIWEAPTKSFRLLSEDRIDVLAHDGIDGLRIVGIYVPDGHSVSADTREQMRNTYGREAADWLIERGELRAKLRSGE
jgi:hypothetical protein